MTNIPNPPKKLSPLRAIKYHCKYECCVGDTISWKNCNVNCILKPYRFGKNPFHISTKARVIEKMALNLKKFEKDNPSSQEMKQ